MVEAGVHNLVACALQVLQPMLLRALVQVASIEDATERIRQGLMVSAVVAVAVVVQALSTQRQMHLAMRAGTRMRAVVLSEVYDTALRLTASGRQGVSNGEVTNLVANDAQKLFEVTLAARIAGAPTANRGGVRSFAPLRWTYGTYWYWVPTGRASAFQGHRKENAAASVTSPCFHRRAGPNQR